MDEFVKTIYKMNDAALRKFLNIEDEKFSKCIKEDTSRHRKISFDSDSSSSDDDDFDDKYLPKKHGKYPFGDKKKKDKFHLDKKKCDFDKPKHGKEDDFFNTLSKSKKHESKHKLDDIFNKTKHDMDDLEHDVSKLRSKCGGAISKSEVDDIFDKAKYDMDDIKRDVSRDISKLQGECRKPVKFDVDSDDEMHRRGSHHVAPLSENGWQYLELTNFSQYTKSTTNPNSDYLTYAYDASNNPYTFDVTCKTNGIFTKRCKSISVNKTGIHKIKGVCYNDISTSVPGQENNTIVQSLFMYRNKKTSLYFSMRDYDNINATTDTIIASPEDEIEFKIKFKSGDIPDDFKIRLFVKLT